MNLQVRLYCTCYTGRRGSRGFHAGLSLVGIICSQESTKKTLVGEVKAISTGTSRQSPLGLVKIIPVYFRVITNSCYYHTSHRGQTKAFSVVGPRSGHSLPMADSRLSNCILSTEPCYAAYSIVTLDQSLPLPGLLFAQPRSQHRDSKTPKAISGQAKRLFYDWVLSPFSHC